MRVELISWIPRAGKTTVARKVASRIQRTAHLEGDLIGHDFIVSGLVPPQGPPRDEAEAQLELRRRNICMLADSFAEAGFVPVIDDVVVSPSVLDAYPECCNCDVTRSQCSPEPSGPVSKVRTLDVPSWAVHSRGHRPAPRLHPVPRYGFTVLPWTT